MEGGDGGGGRRHDVVTEGGGGGPLVVIIGVFHVLDVVTLRHEGGGDGADAAPYKSLRKKKLVQ